jgi:hypothetical protein
VGQRSHRREDEEKSWNDGNSRLKQKIECAQESESTGRSDQEFLTGDPKSHLLNLVEISILPLARNRFFNATRRFFWVFGISGMSLDYYLSFLFIQ